MANTSVSLEGPAYRVIFKLDPEEKHLVQKNCTCSCGEKDCFAIKAVETYLREGGKRAPDLLPPCPICGGSTVRNSKWDGKYTKELGWLCLNGGLSHFLQAKRLRIQENIAKNPYILPPAEDYAGVKREDILTWQQCLEIGQRIFQETGYNPAM